MPKQPYLKVVPNHQGASIDVGVNAIGQRPQLEALVGACLMNWSHVEAEMALLLGQLMRVENAVALVVFQALRQSRTQREAIEGAGKIALMAALLNLHKSLETERNALAHGHFGTSTKVPDGLIWMSTGNYISTRVDLSLASNPVWDDPRHLKLLSSVWVYREPDLKKISEDMTELADEWYNFIVYLRMTDPKTRAEKYRQLCDRPHIDRELTILRQKNNP